MDRTKAQTDRSKEYIFLIRSVGHIHHFIDGVEELFAAKQCISEDDSQSATISRPLELDTEAGQNLWRPDFRIDRILKFEPKGTLDKSPRFTVSKGTGF